MNLKTCVLIPVYNNAATIADVARRSSVYLPVLVINDGSTDGTEKELAGLKEITYRSFNQNQGKGAALRYGFELARELGYDAVITLDGDGQHFPEEIPAFLNAAKKTRGIIIGIRKFEENVTGRSKFGRNLSNFLATLCTFQKVQDAQSGFRLYFLAPLKKIKVGVSRYDFEIELLIRALWKNIPLGHVPISVHYDEPEKRISHFHAFYDNVRQSAGFFKLGFFAFFRVPFRFLLMGIQALLKKKN